jgi:putative transposase
MRGSIGCPTRIVTIVPRIRELAKSETKELSKKAKRRLEIFDWYRSQSPKFSLSGKAEAKLTCRHFGIQRSEFYRWKKRFDPKRLSSLEDESRAPKKKREPEYSRGLVRAVREIRKADPTYSAKKIRPILLRTMAAEQVPSVATLGRLISRESLFFRTDTKLRRKRSNSAKKAHERKRKPYDLKATGSKQIVEFDMKHVYLLGQKLYANCAIDIHTKVPVVRVASSPSSRNGKACMEQVVAKFGKGIAIVNDNGSENMKEVEAYLAEQGIAQYWTRPHSPKEKPFVERFIGTLQRECLDYHYEPMNVAELQEVVDAWVEKYCNYRPHESLGFLTPTEFCAKIALPTSA